MNPEKLPLRDIHLPEVVNWWPIASIWWVILAFIIIIPVVYYYYRRWKRAHFVTIAIKQFSMIETQYKEHQDSARFIKDISIFLRQCVMTLQPRKNTAAMTGSHWLKLLDNLGETDEFSSGSGSILLTAPYQLQPVANIDALQNLVKDWIKIAYRVKKKNKTNNSGEIHA